MALRPSACSLSTVRVMSIVVVLLVTGSRGHSARCPGDGCHESYLSDSRATGAPTTGSRTSPTSPPGHSGRCAEFIDTALSLEGGVSARLRVTHTWFRPTHHNGADRHLLTGAAIHLTRRRLRLQPAKYKPTPPPEAGATAGIQHHVDGVRRPERT